MGVFSDPQNVLVDLDLIRLILLTGNYISTNCRNNYNNLIYWHYLVKVIKVYFIWL